MKPQILLMSYDTMRVAEGSIYANSPKEIINNILYDQIGEAEKSKFLVLHQTVWRTICRAVKKQTRNIFRWPNCLTNDLMEN